MMAKGPSYTVPYRRRREGKTNYELRRKLVSSGLPRLVVRRTQKHIVVQLIEAASTGDKVVTSAHSSELRKKYGWLGSVHNLSASYLTGLLCGYRAAAKGVKKVVLDIGLQTPSRGARVFAALKGFLDAGGEVSHDEEVLPDEARIAGQHIADNAAKVASDPDAYSRMFSRYLSRGISPQKVTEHFSAVKASIISDLGQ